MESNIEEPLSIEEAAHYAQVSRRQIDRLFHRYEVLPVALLPRVAHHPPAAADDSPSASIAIACGTGAPHFSRCYRDFFGVSPSKARSTQRL